MEELACQGSHVTNADLVQQLNWSGDQKDLLPPPRRTSRSLSPAGSPQASSTRRSTNVGSDISAAQILCPEKAIFL